MDILKKDPNLNATFNTLKNFGADQTAAGKTNTAGGIADINTGMGNLNPVASYYRTGLSGDTTALMQQSKPQIDAIGKQFANIRNMIAMQGRGGGKTSTLASAPIAQVGDISNILSNERNASAGGLADVATRQAGIGSQLGQIGLGQSGQGLQADEGATQTALGAKEFDVANGWGSFFKGLVGDLVKGAGAGAGGALTAHFVH